MKKLLFILLSTLVLTTYAQDDVKRIAILETVDRTGDVTLGVKNLLRQSITFGINRIPGYEGYNRVDMVQISGEQNFQRTGYVSDADIKKLGVMTGASYVLIAEATTYDATHILVFANLVDVESGRITNSSIPKVAGVAPNEMYEDCAEVAKSLLGVYSKENGINKSALQNERKSTNQDYIEDAWDINMKMVWVEGGEFQMGCTSEQGICGDDIEPAHYVSVDDFYIGMYEVTQLQWEKVMGSTIYQQKSKTEEVVTYGCGANYPMYFVNIDEISEFLDRLSRKTGKKYVLPTEMQWEYAARGGKNHDGTLYSGGNIIDDIAWYKGNSNWKTHPCGEKNPNSLGIYDMTGNLMEWCSDTFDYYNIIKGCGFLSEKEWCRIADYNSTTPNERNVIGFRVVCIP